MLATDAKLAQSPAYMEYDRSDVSVLDMAQGRCFRRSFEQLHRPVVFGRFGLPSSDGKALSPAMDGTLRSVPALPRLAQVAVSTKAAQSPSMVSSPPQTLDAEDCRASVSTAARS